MEIKHYSGLNEAEVKESRKRFGKNTLTPPPRIPGKIQRSDYPDFIGSSGAVTDYFNYAQRIC